MVSSRFLKTLAMAMATATAMATAMAMARVLRNREETILS